MRAWRAIQPVTRRGTSLVLAAGDAEEQSETKTNRPHAKDAEAAEDEKQQNREMFSSLCARCDLGVRQSDFIVARRAVRLGTGIRARLARVENKKAPEVFEASEANLWGWAFVTRSFPVAHAWTRSLSRAVCFPTPLSAACGCFGLMAGPSWPLPAGIF